MGEKPKKKVVEDVAAMEEGGMDAKASTKKAKKEKKTPKKEKKAKKHKKETVVDSDNEDEDVKETPVVETAKEKETPKSNKKDKKKEKSSTKATDDKEDKKRKREEKKQKKKESMEKVPKRDADGISYTKQQLRRMSRRVERGLPPIPTPEEEAELKRQEAELRKEEERELAGMIISKGGDDDEESDDDDDEENDNEDDDDSEQEEDEPETSNKEKRQRGKEDKQPPKKNPAKKQKLSKKPVPADYVCQACQNKHDFPHWIYDCPDKVTVKGANQVAAGHKDKINAPSAKKVFVSGLFFDTKVNDVKAMFQAAGKVTSCKMLKFPDTGRCKGQAFVVFETEEAAKKALKMDGTKISSSGTNTKGKKGKNEPVERELELKVHKAMSRAFTKAKK